MLLAENADSEVRVVGEWLGIAQLQTNQIKETDR